MMYLCLITNRFSGFAFVCHNNEKYQNRNIACNHGHTCIILGICREDSINPEQKPVFITLPEFYKSIFSIAGSRCRNYSKCYFSQWKRPDQFTAVYESRRDKEQCQRVHPDLHRIVGDLRHGHYQEPEQPCNMQSEVLPNRRQCINKDSHKRKHRCKLTQYDRGSRRNQYLSNIMKELQIPVIKRWMYILSCQDCNFPVTMLYKIH